MEKSDSLQKNITTSIKKENQDSISYFIGFHHVRIFNDSIQAASDSLYYSTEDSTFKLFQQPICWNGSTQITGDTMFLCTENKQPKEVKVFYNTLVINKTPEGLYNQISGKTINGYFKEGEIYYIKTKGNPAESIFYPQDEDNAYTGMNKSTSDVIELFIVNKNANKIKYINDVKGILYPMNQIPEQLKLLKNFNWQDTRRPKNKLELFE
jgi:lipopolysaccharide export system protein LptA